ncbi:MAG TPA: bifunctional 4-hydroxy-2-oxoglutarate aldolase/2-dehydro-3-deoxy-phosphogluconate aldolase [Burkholderiaceae bacterium]|nr:bifunctional 4-hydroxy-2-oxoglutarate aldolase/2-dehydro-3-deoxy-phosphogluconate aldolase [Burkholderiaceae bacterium]
MKLEVDAVMRIAPVIPVIVVERAADAAPLARALVAGGLRALEVTLRTAAGLDAIRAMAAVDGAVVGAGTVLDAAQFEAAVAAGARFVVSPGYADEVAAAARASGVPWLPGVATATEIMRARAAGLRRLKFFPAESSGGVAALKAFSSVFPDVAFCPTGGVGPSNAAQYLALPNVVCVGGSWVAPAEAMAAGGWSRIEQLAADASRLRG